MWSKFRNMRWSKLMPSDFEPVQSMGCGKPISWECSFITKDNEFARLPFKSFSLRENFVKRTKHDSFIWCEKSERGPFDLDVDKYAILGPFLVRLCCSAGGMNWVSLMLGFFISFLCWWDWLIFFWWGLFWVCLEEQEERESGGAIVRGSWQRWV